ncbi:MAG: HEAT repeat domain-containing protein [Candidatus Paceibacterota bacterium]
MYIPNPREAAQEADASVLTFLAKSEDKVVRHTVASNLDCPDKVIEALLFDPDEDVRRAAQDTADIWTSMADARDSTDSDRLRELASHKHPAVRRQIAENASCPQEIREILKKDGNDEVRKAAQTGPREPPTIM